MEIIINIPDEQIEKSLAESKYIHENEGEKGSVNIVLLYTNKKLEFVDISRKTDFYSLTDKYTVLPKGHGRLIDANKTISEICGSSCGCHLEECGNDTPCYSVARISSASTIIEADTESEEV